VVVLARRPAHRLRGVLGPHRVDPSGADALGEQLDQVVAEGVRTGRIDTVRPEHTPEAMGRAPRKDDHGGEVYVYRRTGQPCLVCGTKVRTRELVGRNLFWCPRCQPTFRSRAVR
jgi:endonuclease-8